MTIIDLFEYRPEFFDEDAKRRRREHTAEQARKVRIALYARPARAKSRAARICRLAKWADKHAIELIYAKAARLTKRTGIPHEVDHVIPLVGKLVSGLHVETNLRVITRIDNQRKSNRFEVVDGAGIEPATLAV